MTYPLLHVSSAKNSRFLLKAFGRIMLLPFAAGPEVAILGASTVMARFRRVSQHSFIPLTSLCSSAITPTQSHLVLPIPAEGIANVLVGRFIPLRPFGNTADILSDNGLPLYLNNFSGRVEIAWSTQARRKLLL